MCVRRIGSRIVIEVRIRINGNIPLINKTKDENGIVFYEGAKVYTNDKKALLDYYRKGAVKFNQNADEKAKEYERLELQASSYHWNSQMYKTKISTTQKVYKKLVDRIKAL